MEDGDEINDFHAFPFSPRLDNELFADGDIDNLHGKIPKKPTMMGFTDAEGLTFSEHFQFTFLYNFWQGEEQKPIKGNNFVASPQTTPIFFAIFRSRFIGFNVLAPLSL